MIWLQVIGLEVIELEIIGLEVIELEVIGLEMIGPVVYNTNSRSTEFRNMLFLPINKVM